MENWQKYKLIKEYEKQEAKKTPQERARENFSKTCEDLERLADEGMPIVSFYRDEKGKLHFKLPPKTY